MIYLVIFLDLVESLFLSTLLLVLHPTFLFHGESLKRIFYFARVLLPETLLSSAIRGIIDEKIAQLDRATVALESVIGSIESSMIQDSTKHPPELVYVLKYLYQKLAKIQLKSGQVDDAAYTVLRAFHTIKVESLDGLSDFNCRIAQIVRAGIAAGKMLEQNGGVATLMLNHPGPRKLQPKVLKPKTVVKKNLPHATIIPFPKPWRS